MNSVTVDIDNFITHAVNNILSSVQGRSGFVLILTPPGSFRGRVVESLAGALSSAELLVYDELYSRLSSERPELMPRLRRLRGLSVEDKDVIDYIRGGYGSVGEALRSRQLVVVPKSTAEALWLISRLGEAIGSDRGLLSSHVRLHHLSALYVSAVKAQRTEWLTLRHRALAEHDVAGYLVGSSKGISLRLLSEVQGGGLREDEARRGVEAIQRLSPGRVGLSDAVGLVIPSLPGALLPLAPVPAVIASLSALAASALLNEDTARGIVYRLGELADELAERAGTGKGLLRALAKGALRSVAGKSARNKFLASIAELLKAVVEAHKYVNDLRFEGVVDDVASEWGLDVDTFRNFINNMYEVATRRLATADELEALRGLSDERFTEALERLIDRRWGAYARELDNRLDELREEIERLRREVRELVAPLRLPVYFDAESLGVEFRNNEVIIRDVLLRDKVSYVHNPLEDAIVRALMDLPRGGLAVVVGPKGVGKSVAARVAAARLLSAEILVSDVYYEPIIVEIAGDVNITNDDVKRVARTARESGYSPIFYLDPSKPGHYPVREGGRYRPEFIEWLSSAIDAFADADAPLLVVLSDDQYRIVSQAIEALKDEGVRVIEVRVNDYLKDRTSFLSEVAEKYSRCGRATSAALANTVASEFNDNYAVATVIAADWLSRNSCNADQVDKALERAKGRVYDFIKSYLWYGVMGRDQRERSEYAERLAPLMLVAGTHGPVPRRLAVEYLRAWGRKWDGMDNDPALLWFTQQTHETVREALHDMFIEAVGCVSRGSKCNYGGDDPNYIVSKVSEVIRQAFKGDKDVTLSNVTSLDKAWLSKTLPIAESIIADLEEKLSSMKDFDEHVKRVINDNDKHDLARLVGLAYTPKPIELLRGSRLVETLSDWLLVEGKMTPIVKAFLTVKAPSFAELFKKGSVTACSIINEIYERAERRGEAEDAELLEVLGLLAIMDGGIEAECLGKAGFLAIAAAPIASKYDVNNDLHTLYNIHRLWSIFAKLMEKLIDGGMYDETAALLHATSLMDPEIAEYIYVHEDIASDPTFIIRLSWAGKLVYAKALRMMLERTSWARTPEKLPQITRTVLDIINGICGDSDKHEARCLYAKADLYPLIARYKPVLILGGVIRSGEYISADEALRAVEELGRKGESELAGELEPLLRLMSPFRRPAEQIRDLLRRLRRDVYLHVALEKALEDPRTALSYAREACTISREADSVEGAYYVMFSCGLQARLKFIMGDIKEAKKEFRELWEEEASRPYITIFTMGIESVGPGLAHYLMSLLATEDPRELKEAEAEYKQWDLTHSFLLRLFYMREPELRAPVAGLLKVHGISSVDIKDFYETVRLAVKRSAPAQFRGVLECLEEGTNCEEACQALEDLNARELCSGLAKAINDPELMRGAIVSTAKEGRRDLVSQLLRGVDDPREMIELRASLEDPLLSFIELLRLIIGGRPDKAGLIAEYQRRVWYELSQPWGTHVPASLWGELAKALRGGGGCDGNCRVTLLKLFYLLL